MLAELAQEGRCRVLLLHHPPVATMTDYRRRLVDADDFARVLQAHPVELVLCGHQHIFQIGGLSSDGSAIPVVGAPSASLHGGDRHHEGGYLIYDLIPTANGGWAIDLELRRFDLATASFAPVFKRRVQTATGSALIRLEGAV